MKISKEKIKPGIKIEKLTLLENIGKKYGKTYWKVKCDCGKIFETSESNLLERKK